MKVLVTGGAGFIGSNLVGALIKDPKIELVRVIDNLSNGSLDNIQKYLDNDRFEFVNGDISDFDTAIDVTNGIDKISHQAAMGSVPRSIKNPVATHLNNATGTLNIFRAAIENKVERVVFASSSSVYGDDQNFPKQESKTGSVLSPYALTKVINERYAEVLAMTDGLKYVGLRYFNVFGPNQSPKGPYAAVIPIFMDRALNNKNPIINGDGSYSRDFTFVANAVQANIKALTISSPEAINQVYNIAFGNRTTLNELWESIRAHTNCNKEAIHGPKRFGDIPHSFASIDKAKKLLGYNPEVSLNHGIGITMNWYKTYIDESIKSPKV